MSKFLKIQPSIFCENCLVCGSRPVIAQIESKYVVRCPQNEEHYQTKAGYIDINDWNVNNDPSKKKGDF